MSAADFSYDAATFEREMDGLNKLENKILNPHLNDPEIFELANLNDVLGGLRLSHSAASIDQYGFNWGFCCWPIGFFVVAINPKSFKEERFAYFIGTVANIAIIAVSVTLARDWLGNIDLNFM